MYNIFLWLASIGLQVHPEFGIVDIICERSCAQRSEMSDFKQPDTGDLLPAFVLAALKIVCAACVRVCTSAADARDCAQDPLMRFHGFLY